MRYMIIAKSDANTESGAMPTPEAVAALGRFNDALIEAGALLAAEGLHASAKGARIRKQDGQHVVIDGPFSESKELIAGFWLIQVKDRDEAIAWCRRIPLFEEGEEVELRQVFDVADFPAGESAQEQPGHDASRNPTGR